MNTLFVKRRMVPGLHWGVELGSYTQPRHAEGLDLFYGYTDRAALKGLGSIIQRRKVFIHQASVMVSAMAEPPRQNLVNRLVRMASARLCRRMELRLQFGTLMTGF